MKNSFRNDLSEEFFERRIRRHPVWKSESEYKAFVLDSTSGGKWLEKFEKAMSVTAMYLIKSTDSWVIALLAFPGRDKDHKRKKCPPCRNQDGRLSLRGK